MKKERVMKKVVFFVLLTLFCTVNAAATSLWMVRNNGSVTYLAGTCHVLRQSDYPLPEEFAAAYEDSKVVVFEVDPGRLTSPEMQMALASRAVYTDGRTIAQVLRPETYRLLRDYCDKAGLQLQALERLKPPILALTLLAHELQRHGVDQRGVDLYFHERAVADRKQIAALETADQQIEFILAMGKGNEDRFIESALADLEKLDENFDRLITAWRDGDEAALTVLVEEGTKSEFPEIYRTLFTDRNAAWLPEIEGYLQTPETELVLVGVGHLVGKEGLVSALRKRGYEVSKVE
jgi:hypothetical protein